MEKQTIGQFLSALRRSNGYTQQGVAEKLGVSNKTVSCWERDAYSPISRQSPPWQNSTA